MRISTFCSEMGTSFGSQKGTDDLNVAIEIIHLRRLMSQLSLSYRPNGRNDCKIYTQYFFLLHSAPTKSSFFPDRGLGLPTGGLWPPSPTWCHPCIAIPRRETTDLMVSLCGSFSINWYETGIIFVDDMLICMNIKWICMNITLKWIWKCRVNSMFSKGKHQASSYCLIFTFL